MTYRKYSLSRKVLLLAVSFLLLSYMFFVWAVFIFWTLTIPVKTYLEQPEMIAMPAFVLSCGYALLTSCALVIYIERYAVRGVPTWVRAGLTVGGILYVIALITFNKKITNVPLVMLSGIVDPIVVVTLCLYLMKRLRRHGELSNTIER